jgi:hypothetical protein
MEDDRGMLLKQESVIKLSKLIIINWLKYIIVDYFRIQFPLHCLPFLVRVGYIDQRFLHTNVNERIAAYRFSGLGKQHTFK